MRNWKLPLILLVISAVLAVFLLLPEKQQPAEPVPASTPKAAAVKTYSAQDIAHVRVRAAENSWTYSVEEQDGKLVFGSVDYPAEFPMDQTLLWAFIRNSANPLHSFKKIEENPADLSVYGLDAPSITIAVEFADGGAQTLAIGNESPLGDGFYLLVKADEKQTVCLTNADFRAQALGGPLGFRRMQLLPVWGTDSDSFIRSVAAIRLHNPAGGGFCIQAFPVREGLPLSDALQAGLVTIQMTEPEQTNANIYNLDTYLLGAAHALCGTYAEVATDTPQDLAQYGLDDPIELELVSALGMRATLRVGSEEPATGKVYVQREGSDTVGLADAALVSFIREADYFRYMNTTVWVYDYTEIQQVIFESADGTRHVFDMDGRDPDAFRASLDGAEITRDEATALYLAFLSIVMDGKVEEGWQPSADPAYTVTMVPFSGEPAVVELFEINYRQFAIRKNGGEIRYYCNVSVIEDILGRLEK